MTFHGFLPQSSVLDVLSRSDLYVQSSLHEAAGVSVLEAAAAGVPVLGTLAGYVADWSPIKAMALGDAIPESLADAILTLARGSRSPPLDGRAGADVFDRARRDVGRGEVRRALSKSEVLRS